MSYILSKQVLNDKIEKRIKKMLHNLNTMSYRPSVEELNDIVSEMIFLNRVAKNKRFPIMKTPFYRIKSILIQYLILSSFVDDNIEVSFDKIEHKDDDKHGYLAITINLTLSSGVRTYRIHSPLDKEIRNLYNDIQPTDITETEFFSEKYAYSVSAGEIVERWEHLLRTFVEHKWFLFSVINSNGDWLHIFVILHENVAIRRNGKAKKCKFVNGNIYSASELRGCWFKIKNVMKEIKVAISLKCNSHDLSYVYDENEILTNLN